MQWRTNLPKLFRIAGSISKDSYRYNTSPCVNISVSVHHDSSFRKNGFVLLLCKFSKKFFLCKILDITFSFCHQKEKVCKRKILVIEDFCDWAMVFLFPLSAQRKRKKKKSAGYAPELKNRRISLNEKNSLRSNSFSFLTENTRFFFTLLHWGRNSPP